MKIGFAFCGSFCTFAPAIEQLKHLADIGHEMIPIMSFNASSIDTRFGAAADHIARIETICARNIIKTIADAEPLGPSRPMEQLIVAPTTGNTLAKLASGITDTAVTMAAKAHLRCDRPLLLAIASNDAMSQNLQNIARVITRRSVYLVPMRQDDPTGKPHSLVSDFSRLYDSFEAMRRGEQLRPLFI